MHDEDFYDKLRKSAHKLEQWFDVGKIKSYSVYVWTKDEDDEHAFGENVFDIFKDYLQFYPSTKPWRLPNEVWPIIQEIQELLNGV